MNIQNQNEDGGTIFDYEKSVKNNLKCVEDLSKIMDPLNHQVGSTCLSKQYSKENFPTNVGSSIDSPKTLLMTV